MPEVPLTFENGLYEGQEASLLPVGFATKLENWIAEPNGSLRCRAGWAKGSVDGLPATPFRGRGFGFRGSPVRLPVVRQKVTGAEVTSGNVTATWDDETKDGSLLIAVVTAAHPTNQDRASFGSMSGWTGLTDGGVDSASGSAYAKIFYKADASPEASAVSLATATLDAVGLKWRMTLLEVPGVSPASPLDKTATDSTNSGTAIDSGTTAATTQDEEFIIAALSVDTATNVSAWSNSFTEQVDVSHHHIATKTVTATGAQSTQATIASAAAVGGGVIATFKAERPLQGVSHTLVAHDTTTAYKILGVEDIEEGEWSELDSVTMTSTRPIAFSSGMDVVAYTSADFATLRRWNGSAAGSVADGPPGRAIEFHQDRFFVGGTLLNPTRLYFSKVADYTDWTTSVDVDDAGFIDIGLNDGFAIESLAVFEGGLLIAKGNSLWFLAGETSDQYSVIPLNGGGAAPGKSVCATPYGVVIAGLTSVSLWTGQGVESISENVETSYEITGFATVDYIDKHAYICDSGTGTIYVLNVETGTWHIETLSDSAEAPAVIAAHRDRLLYAPRLGVDSSLVQFRSHPKEDRVKDFIDETFVMWTPEYRLGGVSKALTPGRLKLALRQRGPGTEPLMLTPYYDGVAGTEIEIPMQGEGTYVVRPSVGEKQGLEKVQFRVEHTVTEDCLIDIEAASLEYELTER